MDKTKANKVLIYYLIICIGITLFNFFFEAIGFLIIVAVPFSIYFLIRGMFEKPGTTSYSYIFTLSFVINIIFLIINYIFGLAFASIG